MKIYIEFLYDENNNYIALIHKNGKIRRIRNENNIKNLIKICKKKGYDIDGREGIVKEESNNIIKEYEQYYEKRIKRLNILGNITQNMKLSRKNITIGKRIAIASLAAVLVAAGISHIKGKPDPSDLAATYVTEIDNDNIIEIDTDEDEIIQAIDNALEEEKEIVEKIPEQDQTSSYNDNMIEMFQTEEFHFSYEDRTEEENIRNAKRYEDLFEKYANRYGMDKNLLMAMAAQESNGDHNSYINRGPAEGLMQIEKSAHLDTVVSAYNFETNQIEKETITLEKLQDVEYNIKIGTMILRNCMEENNYNIPLAIQAYNFGTGNMAKSINTCSDLENISKDEIKNNPSNNIWLLYREFVHAGDPKYVEHVFSFLKSGTTLKILDKERNEKTITIINDHQKTL